MTPLWFVVHRGTIYVTTGTRSWAGRNVAQHPGVTLLFGGERATGRERMLRLRGRAVCEAGLPPWPVLLRVAARYHLAPRALLVAVPVTSGSFPHRPSSCSDPEHGGCPQSPTPTSVITS